MLNSILEMVTKAKGLLFILKQKDNYLRHLAETNDLEWRRKHAHMLKQTEDRIVESQRKAGNVETYFNDFKKMVTYLY